MWSNDKRVHTDEKALYPDLQLQKSAGDHMSSPWAYESTRVGAAVDGRMLTCFHKCSVQCRCGVTNPTRRHLTWYCSTLEERRRALGLLAPRAATAEEGLLVFDGPCPQFFQSSPTSHTSSHDIPK